ncbi:MAG TPA: alpha/beta fold hydrolase [Turneriella sp.]|nr:alpha/beta fold hydrolase [Turneriella sp.]
MVHLHYDYYAGDKSRTVIFLHGLFGSAKNFTTLAESITDVAETYALDARNHGRSPHTETHNLDDLVLDVKNFIGERSIKSPILIGHSMGGLTAMAYASENPVRGLVILDIAPRSYAPGHMQEIVAQKMDLSAFKTRQEIDTKMAEILPNKTVRQFLQMNINRVDEHFIWTNNIAAIERSQERTQFPNFKFPLYIGPVLGVRGLQSDYVTDTDVQLMHKAFPQLTMHDFADATHWLHHTHRAVLLQIIRSFLVKL